MIAVRRVGALLVAGLGLAAAAGAQTAYPIFTPDHLDATMKTLGPNVAGVHAAIRADDTEIGLGEPLEAWVTIALRVALRGQRPAVLTPDPAAELDPDAMPEHLVEGDLTHVGREGIAYERLRVLTGRRHFAKMAAQG